MIRIQRNAWNIRRFGEYERAAQDKRKAMIVFCYAMLHTRGIMWFEARNPSGMQETFREETRCILTNEAILMKWIAQLLDLNPVNLLR